MTKQTINLSDISKLRELNKQNRLLQRSTKKQQHITVTGTFPTAKFWNSQQLKKEAYAEGIEVNAAVVEEIRVKWIVAKVDETTVYLKLTEEASGTVTFE